MGICLQCIRIFLYPTSTFSLLLKAAVTSILIKTSGLDRETLKTLLLCLGDIRITVYSETQQTYALIWLNETTMHNQEVKCDYINIYYKNQSSSCYYETEKHIIKKILGEINNFDK